MEAMQACLAASGYQVRPYGLGPSERAGSTIYQQLVSFCRTAPQGSTLFIYFSCHGLHHRGKDYVVPADFDPLNAEEFDRLLVPIDITAAVESSRAHAVIVAVDACRTGVDLDNLDVKGSVFAAWGKAKLARVSGRKFAIIFGCSPGQFCQYVSGEEPFSLFTRALISALALENPATSVKQVTDAAQKELDRLVTLHGKSSQQIRIVSEQTPDGLCCSDVVICDADSPAAVVGARTDLWSASVARSPLWTGMKNGLGTFSEKLQHRVLAVVAGCRRQFEQGRDIWVEDPWLDEGLPCRVVDRLGFLIEQSDPRIEVSVSERALLLVAPFLREALLANGLQLAAAANPLDPNPIPPGEWKEPYRGKLEQIFQSSPQLVRKAARMLELKRANDHKAVLKWLVHRAVLLDPQLWLPAPAGLMPQGILRLLWSASERDITDAEDLALAQSLDPSVALELAKCVCSDPGRLERNDSAQPLHFAIQMAPATPFEQTVRARALGYLLSLAGWLAIGPRLFSDVVVDHVGLASPLLPSELLRYTRGASWHAIGKARSLHLTCEHPAADLAFREYTSRAASVLASCHRAAVEHGQSLSILSGLPTGLTADGVIPSVSGGVPAYQLAHLKFELAQDEIRELLMGEQLYGSPAYAIRELYQNALDALRYRGARLTYLRQAKGIADSWQGRIAFRQDITADGREYIECEDNGIGMGHRELSECFAKAGKRFSTLPEFVEERIQWLQCDPPIHIYPNSQFGVGVFSYFMLADEIEIETCRLDRDGKPDQRIEVEISSGGSLFRVKSLGPGNDSGTRIRLFLNKKEYKQKFGVERSISGSAQEFDRPPVFVDVLQKDARDSGSPDSPRTSQRPIFIGFFERFPYERSTTLSWGERATEAWGFWSSKAWSRGSGHGARSAYQRLPPISRDLRKLPLNQ
jgi:hypothetical protein